MDSDHQALLSTRLSYQSHIDTISKRNHLASNTCSHNAGPMTTASDPKVKQIFLSKITLSDYQGQTDGACAQMEKVESYVYQVALGDQYTQTQHHLPAGSGQQPPNDWKWD
ncbi:hypothetical protein STEG23_030347 [Scotinomys teguina]